MGCMLPVPLPLGPDSVSLSHLRVQRLLGKICGPPGEELPILGEAGAIQREHKPTALKDPACEMLASPAPPPNPFPASALPSVWRSSSLLSCHCPPFLSFFSRYPLLLLSPRGSQFLPSLRSETLISSWVLTPFFFLSQHFQHHSSSSFCSFTVSRQSKLSRVSLQQFANQNNLEDSFRDLRLGSPSPPSSRSDSR